MNLPKVYANKKTNALIDMTLSVNPLGPSKKALQAISKLTAADISRYPDDSTLRSVVAKKFKIVETGIVFGSGSEQLIKLIAQSFLGEGNFALVQIGSFPLFSKESKLAGAQVILFDPRNITTKVQPKLLFISNPSTPTGEVFTLDIIKNILSLFPKAIVVVDEANGEYFTDTSTKLLPQNPNLIVLRTFSKVLGLAGIRLGFALGSGKTIGKLANAQQPFAASSVACTVAIATLADKQFVTNTIRFIGKERRFLGQQLKKLGFEVSDSVTNNLFVSLSASFTVESNKKKFIKTFISNLEKLDVAVIDNSYFPGLEVPGFRISIKDRKTNSKFIKKIKQALVMT